MSQLKIHWICPAPNHYHSYLFNELMKDPEISLEVHFLMESYSQHPWKRKPEMSFKHRVVDLRFGLDFRLFRLALDRDNKFVISGWNRVFLVLLVLWLTILRRDFLFWTDTPNLAKKRQLIRRIVRKAVTQIIFRSARKVLGTGGPCLESLSAMGCPESKLITFPFFVPLPKLGSVEDRFANPTLKIVSVGRIDNSLKGCDIALNAIKIMNQKISTSSFKYFLAGSGPDYSKVCSQAEHLGLSTNVQLLGWLETGEVAQLMRNAHVLLHPARWDPFPVAVLEAMAYGLVVLGSEASGSVRDRIIDGKNGFRHEVGDAKKIAEQLGLLLKHREVLSQMGLAARHTAEEWPASRGIAIIKSAFQARADTYPCAG